MIGLQRQMQKRSRLVSPLAATLLFFSAFAGNCFPPGGEALLWVDSPIPGQIVPPGGVEVLVRFDPAQGVASETFRCLLNGVDVTHDLTTGENGAVGRLYQLLDGENVLRLEVFGRAWWSGDSLVQRAREVRFRSRRPIDLYRG